MHSPFQNRCGYKQQKVFIPSLPLPLPFPPALPFYIYYIINYHMQKQLPASAPPLRVLELGSNRARCAYGYLRFRGASQVNITSIDKKPPQRGHFFLQHALGKALPFSPSLHIEYKQDYLPGCMNGLADSSFDHVHLHMLESDFGALHLGELFAGIKRVLAKGGIFIFSSDDHLISPDLVFYNNAKNATASVLHPIITGNFSLLLSRAVQNGAFMNHFRLDSLEAQQVGSSFGINGIQKHLPEFFSRFSSFVDLCEYFAIARKD